MSEGKQFYILNLQAFIFSAKEWSTLAFENVFLKTDVSGFHLPI